MFKQLKNNFKSSAPVMVYICILFIKNTLNSKKYFLQFCCQLTRKQRIIVLLVGKVPLLVAIPPLRQRHRHECQMEIITARQPHLTGTTTIARTNHAETKC